MFLIIGLQVVDLPRSIHCFTTSGRPFDFVLATSSYPEALSNTIHSRSIVLHGFPSGGELKELYDAKNHCGAVERLGRREGRELDCCVDPVFFCRLLGACLVDLVLVRRVTCSIVSSLLAFSSALPVISTSFVLPAMSTSLPDVKTRRLVVLVEIAVVTLVATLPDRVRFVFAGSSTLSMSLAFLLSDNESVSTTGGELISFVGWGMSESFVPRTVSIFASGRGIGLEVRDGGSEGTGLEQSGEFGGLRDDR